MLTQAWECQFHKLPIRYHLDYAVTKNDKLVAFVEVKVRNYTMDQIDGWGGYMLSVGKLQAAQSLCSISKSVFCLVVHCKDGTYWTTIKNYSEFPVTITGRTDRGDAQDIEPCVLIPKAKFNRLGQ